MHTVFFSPELIQKTRDPDNMTICLKVISTRRELNWWYPDNMQPSTVLLTVHIYTGEDNFFKQERYLKQHSEIKHRTVIGKYKPADLNITMDEHRHMRAIDNNFDDDANSLIAWSMEVLKR